MHAHVSSRTSRVVARGLAWSIVIALAGVSLLGPLAALAHPPGTTERVSVASDGTEGNDASPWFSPAAMSGDGRYVAFNSAATNLIAGGVQFIQLYVHDRRTGTTELASVDSSGRPGNEFSSFPALSADGRYVAFESDATNLARGDRNGITDVFRHDRVTGATIRVSVTSGGQEGAASSHAPAISADGRFVVFHANSGLVPNDTNENTDVYVHDAATGTTELISVALDGNAGNNTSFIQDISADGRFVAFVSDASNLIPNDTTQDADVYVRDRLAGTTEKVSVGTDGTPARIFFFDVPSISADGRYVAFSTDTSLVPEDTQPFSQDIYLRDRQTGTTELISVSSDEVPGDGRSVGPSVSAEGRFVAFQSESTNFVPESSLDEDIFVRDRLAGTTVRVSESSAGEEGNARSLSPDISNDGLVVSFSSDAGNLVPNDTNFTSDVFVHDDRPAADVAVSTTDTPDPVARGEQLTYSVIVTNNGPGTAATVTLTDQLSPNVRFVSVASSTGSCAEADGTVTCELGTLASGDSATVTIVVSARRPGTITNTAMVTSVSPDTNQANNTHIEETVITR